jgi:uncharacterized membrane protein
MIIKIPIIKTITYRILGTLVSFGIAFFFTGDLTIGASFAAGDLLLKPLLYFFHEIAWNSYLKK